jgi:hypothetical protein
MLVVELGGVTVPAGGVLGVVVTVLCGGVLVVAGALVVAEPGGVTVRAEGALLAGMYDDGVGVAALVLVIVV